MSYEKYHVPIQKITGWKIVYGLKWKNKPSGNLT